MLTHEPAISGIGALFDSLSFFVTRSLPSHPPRNVFHLSLDLFIAILATLWVLFDRRMDHMRNSPKEEPSTPTRKYRLCRTRQGRENAKNIYFGLIMGVSAALPTCLHMCLFLLSVFRKSKRALLRPMDPFPSLQDSEEPN